MTYVKVWHRNYDTHNENFNFHLEQMAEFDAKLKVSRTLPKEIYAVIKSIRDGHPMDVLRTAVSALAALEPSSHEVSEEAFIENGENVGNRSWIDGVMV